MTAGTIWRGCCDARQRICISFRDHATDEAKISVIERDSERFATLVVIATEITSRLRWNVHLAGAADGGAFVIWDASGQVYFRPVEEAVAAGR